MAFGNRDRNLDTYDEGDVDIIPLDGTTQEQLIAEIANAQDENSEGSIGDLLAEMDNVQQNIDDIITEIDDIEGPEPTQPPTRRSAQSTRGQRLTKTYEEEYQMLHINDHDNSS